MPIPLQSSKTQAWKPSQASHSSVATVTRVQHDGSFEAQEQSGTFLRQVRQAQSCPLKVRRGDLVYLVSDGKQLYAIAILHRPTTPSANLLAYRPALAANS